MYFDVLGDELSIKEGAFVHAECRPLYCHPNQNRQQQKTVGKSSSTGSRSLESFFSFHPSCLFCGHFAKARDNKRVFDVFKVRTSGFQKTIRDIMNGVMLFLAG